MSENTEPFAFLAHCLTQSIKVDCRQTSHGARVRVDVSINAGVKHRFVLIDRRFDGVKDSELNETFFKVIAFPENNTRCHYIGLNIISDWAHNQKKGRGSDERRSQQADPSDHPSLW